LLPMDHRPRNLPIHDSNVVGFYAERSALNRSDVTAISA
jgi:hypothetical protein